MVLERNTFNWVRERDVPFPHNVRHADPTTQASKGDQAPGSAPHLHPDPKSSWERGGWRRSWKWTFTQRLVYGGSLPWFLCPLTSSWTGSCMYYKEFMIYESIMEKSFSLLRVLSLFLSSYASVSHTADFNTHGRRGKILARLQISRFTLFAFFDSTENSWYNS